MGKKNLDKLFQEKFRDFKEIPDEKVWDDISTSLDRKKSRRLIPFWWKLGGVAALLAVLFVVVNPFKEDSGIVPIISDTEEMERENPNSNEKDGESIFSGEITEEENQVVDTEGKESNAISNSVETQEADEVETQADYKESNLVAPKNNEDKAVQLATSDSDLGIEEEAVHPLHDERKATENIIEQGGEVAKIDDGQSKNQQEQTPKKNHLNEKLNIEDSGEESIAGVDEEKKTEELKDAGKKSIFDEIGKQNEDEEVVTEASKSRWSVGANLAPVYFGSFGEGSPIDPAFVANTKSGDLNMSYGLSVAYDLSDKLSIRAGVNKVDFGYDTNEVEFSASLQGSLSNRLNNVDYVPSAENVVIESKAFDGFALAEDKGSADFISNDISRNGIMAQEFGYIEVPVELDYALIDNRFGVNLVGGLSTMFLTDNSVALNDSGETIELGEANNLNSVNFSTNVGFGLNYKFTPKVRLNVEPVFKYQLNTFSDTSGSFNPFSIGVYSGLNFRF